MYGSRVHRAVILNNETKSGITIHFVNEEYDKGAVIFQKEYALSFSETAESLKNVEIFLALLPFPDATRAIFFVIFTFFQK